MIATRITEMFKIKYPILCGAMMWICKSRLCAAIWNAGGIANLPLDTNVQFLTIMATKMPFVGRG